jgi:superfamily II DNA or RNA helicase
MLLRPRQKLFVERSLAALRTHRNTLGVAPTAAGKTIMLSAVTGEVIAGNSAKACVLAHRDELTDQNKSKFSRVNPSISTSVFDANEKSWVGQATFAMAPTLCRPANLEEMPALDLLVIDEAHHAVADSYRRIIDRALQRNPAVKIFGVTATPNRGDRQGLREVFSNVSDQIRIGELIAAGHLVQPRTFVIDVGVQEKLKAVRKKASDFDMSEVDAIMNKSPVTDSVIENWKAKAANRQTVVFCSTVDHARNVCDAFNAAGVSSALVHGEMSDPDRRATLAAYDRCDIQIITNVSVLTEGWDHPPTSCVVLLRPSSYKSTMIQMVGRGLRTVNPEDYPGVVKTDCVILDFGTSSLIHGSLEQDIDLNGREPANDAPTKTCPQCEAVVPSAVTECPLCGHFWETSNERQDPGVLGHFVMTEIDLLARSSFQWVDVEGDGASLVANGFNAWAGVFCEDGRWYAVGGCKEKRATLLAVGEELICIAAADDWLNANESDESAHKTKAWLRQPPTQKQLAYLPPACRLDFSLTRYQASAMLSLRFNATAIRSRIAEAKSGALTVAA